MLPFKPAASGPSGPDGDPERLAAASALGLGAAEICPLRYPEPLAPGIAEDPAPFLTTPVAETQSHFEKDMSQETCPLEVALKKLRALEARFERRELTVVEGVGGLWVPMPGGTWLPAWIAAFAAAPVVVGRLGLGGVNHALLTILGLRRLGLPPRGFFLVDTTGEDDPAHVHNPALIAAASGLPCLGVLPHAAEGAWMAPGAWDLLSQA